VKDEFYEVESVDVINEGLRKVLGTGRGTHNLIGECV
jgi:hypothetical protein